MGSTVSSALCRVPLLGHWQGPSLQGGRAGRNVQAVLGNEVAEAAVFRDMNFPFLHSWDSPALQGAMTSSSRTARVLGQTVHKASGLGKGAATSVAATGLSVHHRPGSLATGVVPANPWQAASGAVSGLKPWSWMQGFARGPAAQR